MSFKTIKSYFSFSKDQQKGILLLFFIIIVLQMVYFFVNFDITREVYPEEQKWLALESQIDSLKLQKNDAPKIYPFNPNFITDYKGYKLGMSIEEIDRLLAFRKENKYVNSAKEFQDVTHVSDSLLRVIAPFFKFPDWVKDRKEKTSHSENRQSVFTKRDKPVFIDVNDATQEDLIKIYGIGEVLSVRILKFKENLGGFVSMEQMKDIWGLSPEVIEKLNSRFKVFKMPDVKKIAINNASLKELARFPYFKYALAKEIITYRSMNGDIKNSYDLRKIKDFPVDKENIIGLYLDF